MGCINCRAILPSSTLHLAPSHVGRSLISRKLITFYTWQKHSAYIRQLYNSPTTEKAPTEQWNKE